MERVTAEASRGAVSLIAAARVTLVLNRMDKDEAKRFGIVEDKERRRLFTVQDDKANRAPAEDAQWYRLASQTVDNSTGRDDPFGEEGDSVGVVTRWSPPDAFENVTVDHLRAVQALVAGGSYKENHQAADWIGKAVAEVLRHQRRQGCQRRPREDQCAARTWFGTGALVVVEKRDPEKREMKKYVEVGILAEDGAPPPTGGAGRSRGKWGAESAPPHLPPSGAGGGAGGAKASAQVGRGRTSAYVAGNPALGAPRDFSRWERT
ncbi:hypothetical protein AB5I41_28780 [Sphingomonas sp. MMS24-JH45]